MSQPQVSPVMESTPQQSSWLAGDSLASLTVTPDSNAARLMTARSGLKCFGLYPTSSPIGYLAKTLLASSIWHSPIVLLTWQVSATKSGYLFYRLVASGRSTSESGYLSWPTPDARDSQPEGYVAGMRRKEKYGTWGLQTAAMNRGLLPTPNTKDASVGAAVAKEDTFVIGPTGSYRKINRKGTNGSAGLARAVTMFPTPQARDFRSGDSTDSPRMQRKLQQGWSLNLNDVAKMWSTPAAQDAKNASLPPSLRRRDTLPGDLLRDGQTGQLNPTWEAALMGFPPGWLDL